MKLRTLPLSFLLVPLSLGLFAQDRPAPVVASTSLTAAIARAGGAADVYVMAPLELKHPPEYEPKPADLLAVNGARLVVYGGYEKFAQRLAEACGSSKIDSMTVKTDIVPDALMAESAKVAQRLGPQAQRKQADWAWMFARYAEGTRGRVMALWPSKRAAVQGYMKAYAEWMGFEVVGAFGPGEPSPAQLAAIMRAKPDLVIDNYHNPGGAVLAESLKIPYALLINFPGKDGSVSLEDLYAHNGKALERAASERGLK
jgi:hypothetical protein